MPARAHGAARFLLLALVVLSFAFVPTASAAELAASGAEAITLDQLEQDTQCSASSQLDQVGAGCIWCDLELCGCPVFTGCTLVYSCSCSSVYCTRSCDQQNCPQ